MKKYKFGLVILLLLVSAHILSGCGRKASISDKDVIAVVNNEKITNTDLKKEINLKAQFNPMFRITPDTKRDQLELMINRKLIISEAMDLGLAEKDRFRDTIKRFWEQTLIRDFIDYKSNELSSDLKITDKDIQNYYDNMSQLVTFKMLKSANKKSIYDAYASAQAYGNTESWQTVGPLGFEDIISDVLLKAFDMKEGEMQIFSDSVNYYVVQVIKKDKVQLASLESLKPEIKKRILALKEKRLMDNWLERKRKNSKIVINNNLIE